MAEGDEARRGLRRVLLGTAPGLEKFLLAVVPALAVLGVAGYFLGPLPGVAGAVATLVLVLALARDRPA